MNWISSFVTHFQINLDYFYRRHARTAIILCDDVMISFYAQAHAHARAQEAHIVEKNKDNKRKQVKLQCNEL